MAENEERNQSGHSEQPIIVKKIKKGGHAHHGGAWKVAYADFVTALMAFFIVMWILASSEEVKQAVSSYFNNPEEYSPFTGLKTAPVTLFDNPAPPGRGEGDEVQFSFQSGDATDSVKADENLVKAIHDSIEANKVVSTVGDSIRSEIQKMMTETSSLEMQDLLKSIEVIMTNDGLKIELIEAHDNNFFETGSAKLKPDAVRLLRELAKRIRRLGNNVEVEGHTDSKQYAGSGYTNWELSADRANSARRVLEDGGLWSGQIISVTGFADKQLKNSQNPFDYTNRRVSILINNLTTSQFINSDK